MKCKHCRHPLRPEKTLIGDHPGTIKEYAVGYCAPCYKLMSPKKVRPKRPDNCVTCHRKMRPTNTRLEDWPGTVIYKAAGNCATCHKRAKAEAAQADEPEAEITPEVVAALGSFMHARRERIRRQEQFHRVRVAQEAARAQFIASRRKIAA